MISDLWPHDANANQPGGSAAPAQPLTKQASALGKALRE